MKIFLLSLEPFLHKSGLRAHSHPILAAPWYAALFCCGVPSPPSPMEAQPLSGAAMVLRQFRDPTGDRAEDAQGRNYVPYAPRRDLDVFRINRGREPD